MSLLNRIVGRPKINPVDKLRDADDNATGLVFDARWEVAQAPPNTEVGIFAVSHKRIEATTAMVRIFYVNGRNYRPVANFKAPYADGQVTAKWRTAAVDSGNFEAGEYYFEVTVAGYLGATAEPLVLRDASQRYKSSFKPAAAPNRGMPNLQGR